MFFDVPCAVCSFVWQVTQEIREMLEANRAAVLWPNVFGATSMYAVVHTCCILFPITSFTQFASVQGGLS